MGNSTTVDKNTKPWCIRNSSLFVLMLMASYQQTIAGVSWPTTSAMVPRYIFLSGRFLYHDDKFVFALTQKRRQIELRRHVASLAVTDAYSVQIHVEGGIHPLETQNRATADIFRNKTAAIQAGGIAVRHIRRDGGKGISDVDVMSWFVSVLLPNGWYLHNIPCLNVLKFGRNEIIEYLRYAGIVAKLSFSVKQPNPVQQRPASGVAVREKDKLTQYSTKWLQICSRTLQVCCCNISSTFVIILPNGSHDSMGLPGNRSIL